MAKKPVSDVAFTDAVFKNPSAKPSGECVYLDTDLQGWDLVIGKKIGSEPQDLLQEIGRGHKGSGY